MCVCVSISLCKRCFMMDKVNHAPYKIKDKLSSSLLKDIQITFFILNYIFSS